MALIRQDTITGTGSTPWYGVNPHISPVNIAFVGVVSGTVTWQLDYTYDDPNAPFTGATPTVFNPSGYTGLIATKDGAISQPITALRFTVTSGTGTLYGQILQAGFVGT